MIFNGFLMGFTGKYGELRVRTGAYGLGTAWVWVSTGLYAFIRGKYGFVRGHTARVRVGQAYGFFRPFFKYFRPLFTFVRVALLHPKATLGFLVLSTCSGLKRARKL